MTGDDAHPEPKKLCLDQFLKLSWIAETGGHAKFLIQNSEVAVNGEIETRRRRKLVAGDVIEVGGKQFLVKDSLFTEGSRTEVTRSVSEGERFRM